MRHRTLLLAFGLMFYSSRMARDYAATPGRQEEAQVKAGKGKVDEFEALKGRNDALALQAETIQRQGGFIPGIRPGRATVRHLEYVLSRITLPGSIYLALVAVAPSILGWAWNIPVGLSGISILIVVGVALETMKQIESQLMMRNYEGFLT